MKLKLALVDNHGMFMYGFVSSLEQYPEVEKVFSFYPNEIKKITKCLKMHSLDMFLIDINLDGISGFDFAEKIKIIDPKIPIAFITGHGNQANLRTEASEFGAVGFFLKDPVPDEFLSQIKGAVTGKFPGLDGALKLPKLTPREKETLYYVCMGYANKEISQELYITTRQVERHKKNLMIKFSVKNDKKLIRKAIDLGYVVIN